MTTENAAELMGRISNQLVSSRRQALRLRASHLEEFGKIATGAINTDPLIGLRLTVHHQEQVAILVAADRRLDTLPLRLKQLLDENGLSDLQVGLSQLGLQQISPLPIVDVSIIPTSIGVKRAEGRIERQVRGPLGPPTEESLRRKIVFNLDGVDLSLSGVQVTVVRALVEAGARDRQSYMLYSQLVHNALPHYKDRLNDGRRYLSVILSDLKPLLKGTGLEIFTVRESRRQGKEGGCYISRRGPAVSEQLGLSPQIPGMRDSFSEDEVVPVATVPTDGIAQEFERGRYTIPEQDVIFWLTALVDAFDLYQKNGAMKKFNIRISAEQNERIKEALGERKLDEGLLDIGAAISRLKKVANTLINHGDILRTQNPPELSVVFDLYRDLCRRRDFTNLQYSLNNLLGVWKKRRKVAQRIK